MYWCSSGECFVLNTEMRTRECEVPSAEPQNLNLTWPFHTEKDHGEGKCFAANTLLHKYFLRIINMHSVQ